MQDRTIYIANPHGFCAGVKRAVECVEAALAKHGPPVYCLHEIVHNRQVVERLTAEGAVFVETLDAVPEGQWVVFSAHGVAPTVRERAKARHLRILDATCPFVSKLHAEVRAFAARGDTVLLIGHRGHAEVIGLCGEAPESVIVIENAREAQTVPVPDPDRVAVVTQTTLSVDQTAEVIRTLSARFPKLKRPPTDGICRATVHRQEAVKLLARHAGLILVLGSRNSSNTRRLAEVAAACGATAFIVDALDALRGIPVEDAPSVGLTAGASTPESFVSAVLDALQALGFTQRTAVTAAEENMRFSPPKEPRDPP